MKQKFKIGTKVRIGNLPLNMSHFERDCYAIVIGTYVQLCGGAYMEHHYHEYSLMLLDDKGNELGSVSWYPEECLTKESI